MSFFKLVLACLFAIGAYNFLENVVEICLRSDVYACSADKASLPPDVAKQCKRMTRGQWWHQ